MSVSRNNELLRAKQSYSTNGFSISCLLPRVHSKTVGTSFSGKTLNVTGYAQVRFRLACQPYNHYLPPVNGLRESLPPRGRGTACGERSLRLFAHAYLVSHSRAPSVAYSDSSLPEGAFDTQAFFTCIVFYLFSAYRQSLF